MSFFGFNAEFIPLSHTSPKEKKKKKRKGQKGASLVGSTGPSAEERSPHDPIFFLPQGEKCNQPRKTRRFPCKLSSSNPTSPPTCRVVD